MVVVIDMKNIYDDFVTYCPNWGSLKIFGNDVVNFLQGQTSNNVEMEIYSGQLSTLLDSKAHVLALLFIYRVEEKEYFILAPNHSTEWLENHFEKFIIMEDVHHCKNNFVSYLINGLRSYQFLQKTYSDLARLEYSLGEKVTDAFICNYSFLGGEGYVVFSLEHSLFCENRIDKKTFDCLRLERGIPFYGQELSEKNLLPETGLQMKVVDYKKGCFIGQEIVARVKSRGSVNFSLVGLIIEKGYIIKGDLYSDDKRVGNVVNHLYSSHFQKDIAYAYINKKTRKKEKVISFMQDGKELEAIIHKLPFVTDESLIQEAKKLFKKAMALFAQKDEEEEKQAIILLRKAIARYPKYLDAYESLGVILSRYQQYDEAIELMKQLKELNPDEVMAYSNLSVFYMKKGMIKEAEEEKAHATVIGFQKAANQRKERLDKEKQQQVNQQEIKRKMAMFEQVLELDKNDLLANYSLGKSYFDLKQYNDAIPYLQKSLEVKESYSIAYLYLGKCLKKLEKVEEAKKIWQKGAQIAYDNGDLSPAKEMKALLLE